ncbi:MAG: DUF433 domain-containing protein [Planctomycetota bacterium]
MSALLTAHIIIDAQGVAWIEGTRTKVLHLILSKQAYGWSPEEMARQYPHLSLAEIHAALTYYYDNQDEINGQIEADRKLCEEMSTTTGPQPFKKRA